MNARARENELSTWSARGRAPHTSCKANVSGTTAGLRSLSCRRIAYLISYTNIYRNISTSRSNLVVLEPLPYRLRRSKLKKSQVAAIRSKVSFTSLTVRGPLDSSGSPNSATTCIIAEAQSTFSLSYSLYSARRRLVPIPQARTTIAVTYFSPNLYTRSYSRYRSKHDTRARA